MERIPAGMVRSSALAVLRLITSSNFVGCNIGKSAAFSPLRTQRLRDAPDRIADIIGDKQRSILRNCYAYRTPKGLLVVADKTGKDINRNTVACSGNLALSPQVATSNAAAPASSKLKEVRMRLPLSTPGAHAARHSVSLQERLAAAIRSCIAVARRSFGQDCECPRGEP